MSNKPNSTPFVVSFNSNKVLEYYRDCKLSDMQISDLAKAEKKLSSGISISGKFIASPTAQEKAIFMASQLAHAISEENETVQALSCAYLATRYPSLKQLKLTSSHEQLSIELINDQEYADQAPIKFVSKKDLL